MYAHTKERKEEKRRKKKKKKKKVRPAAVTDMPRAALALPCRSLTHIPEKMQPATSLHWRTLVASYASISFKQEWRSGCGAEKKRRRKRKVWRSKKEEDEKAATFLTPFQLVWKNATEKNGSRRRKRGSNASLSLTKRSSRCSTSCAHRRKWTEQRENGECNTQISAFVQLRAQYSDFRLSSVWLAAWPLATYQLQGPLKTRRTKIN